MEKIKKNLNLIAASLLVFFATDTMAQDDKSKRPSPPAQVSQEINGTSVTIDYSQPAVKGRKIWDGLVPYGKVWRTGANEASWIEVSDDVKIGGQTLPKGKYGLFTVPGEDQWTIIFNKTWDQWGAYDYDKDKDVLRVNATPETSSESSERFTIDIADDGKVNMAWVNTVVKFDID